MVFNRAYEYVTLAMLAGVCFLCTAMIAWGYYETKAAYEHDEGQQWTVRISSGSPSR
jgi:hypothetical protein